MRIFGENVLWQCSGFFFSENINIPVKWQWLHIYLQLNSSKFYKMIVCSSLWRLTTNWVLLLIRHQRTKRTMKRIFSTIQVSTAFEIFCLCIIVKYTCTLSLSVTCDRSVVFFRVLRFHPPIKLTATIFLKYWLNSR